ncbi:MAG: ABC transporter permease, partial [Bacteroidales bacterium]
DSEAINAITTTLLMAFAATLFFAVFGIPLAYLLARKNFRLKRIIQGMIDLPVVIPHTAAGIALLTVISPNTTLGGILESIGLSFVGTHAGIALAMAFVSVPFLINAARQGFEMVPVSYEKTSMSLGVSPGRTFFKVSLPLARQSIINGMIMMFARGMSEFGAVVIIAYHPLTIPTLIFERFGAFGLDHARPIAALFVLIALAVFILLRWFATKKDYA